MPSTCTTIKICQLKRLVNKRRLVKQHFIELTEIRPLDILIDQIINYEGSIPKEIILEDKTELEQIRLIEQLEEDKQTIFLLVEKMLTTKKFKDFFNKNVAAL